jgi:hypothetical protein
MAFVIACAPALGCFFPWDGGIGAARKPSESWNEFLHDRPNPVNPEPGETPEDPRALSCPLACWFAGFVALFSCLWIFVVCFGEATGFKISLNLVLTCFNLPFLSTRETHAAHVQAGRQISCTSCEVQSVHLRRGWRNVRARLALRPVSLW